VNHSDWIVYVSAAQMRMFAMQHRVNEILKLSVSTELST